MTQDKAASRRYRVLAGTQTLDVRMEEARLLIDGAPVDYVFEEVSDGYFTLLVEGRSVPVLVEPGVDGRLRVTVAGRTVEVRVQDERDLLLERFGMAGASNEAAREVHAPMPGLVLTVLVEPGQTVKAGDGLLVLEAMKMENELRAPADGVVRVVHAAPGTPVSKNDLLVEFEA